MNKHIEQYDLIERYLNGTLTKAEAEKTEELLASDPGFRKELEQHKQLNKFVEKGVEAGLRHKIAHIHQQALQDPGLRGPGFRQGWYYVVAGAIVISSIVYILIKNPPGKDDSPPKEMSRETVFTQNDKADDIRINEEQVKSHPKSDRIKPETKGRVPITSSSDHEAEEQDLSKPELTQQEDISVPEEKTGFTDSLSAYNEPIAEKMDKSDKDLAEESDTKEKIPREPEGVDCSEINITAMVSIENSCKEKPTGKIKIDPTSIEGGEKPYELGLTSAKWYDGNLEAGGLYWGNYRVFIRDRHDCVSELGTYYIESIDCEPEYKFAPDEFEVWEIPSREKNGIIRIMNKTGQLVFDRRFDSFDHPVWDGLSNDQKQLPMGVYRYHLIFDDGNEETGYVTIIR